MQVPFSSFAEINKTLKSEMMEAFELFFDSQWYILGERVKAFETQYAAYNQVNHCVGVSNGLDALHIALKALGIGPGDEVIVPSNTYIATALAVSYTGATPVFAEPNTNTYNIDAASIAAAITPHTKAVMPVHLYGQCCQMDAIMEVAAANNLFVVEDNAQAQGATFNGKISGSWGHINGTSFYPGKNLGALGDAGAITTNSSDLARQAMVLRNYGSDKKYHNEVIGFNMRLDECQAAFLSVKLKYLDGWIAQRAAIAGLYNEALKDVGDLVLPAVAEGATHAYHLYVVRTNNRASLQQHLSAKNVGTLIHYPIPPHLQQAYAHLGIPQGALPIAEMLANTCVSLPIWPGMSQSQVMYVVDCIRKYFKDEFAPHNSYSIQL